MPLPGIMVDTMDTLDTTDTVMVWDTVDTTVDTTDTPIPTDTTLARDPLTPNLKPKLMLKLNPGLRIWWILRISIQELLRICQSLLWPLLVVIYHFGNPKTIVSKLAKFYPPFELSTNHQLLPSKTLKYLIFFQKRKKNYKHKIRP